MNKTTSPSEDSKKSLFNHLEEIKNLVIKIFLFWLILTVISFYFKDQILEFVLEPLKKTENQSTLLLIRPTDGFMLIFKISAIAGLIFSLPINLYFVWKYLKIALLPKEKKLISGYFSAFFLLLLLQLFMAI